MNRDYSVTRYTSHRMQLIHYTATNVKDLDFCIVLQEAYQYLLMECLASPHLTIATFPPPPLKLAYFIFLVNPFGVPMILMEKYPEIETLIHESFCLHPSGGKPAMMAELGRLLASSKYIAVDNPPGTTKAHVHQQNHRHQYGGYC